MEKIFKMKEWNMLKTDYYRGGYYGGGGYYYGNGAAVAGAAVIGAAVGYTAGVASSTTTVVTAPTVVIGSTVTVLPTGYSAFVVNGMTHYSVGGVYYRPYYRNGATVFVVVNNPY